MLQIKPKKGYLLVAEPSILGDVSFNRSVILLADHNTEGSVGFILNKPMDFFLNDLFLKLKYRLVFITVVLLSKTNFIISTRSQS